MGSHPGTRQTPNLDKKHHSSVLDNVPNTRQNMNSSVLGKTPKYYRESTTNYTKPKKTTQKQQLIIETADNC